ncbi:glycoside hydrolase family 16 protein [Xylariaceae sp. FL0255]|nr:glycoside hydrolase family 16 protein [Xylariaceae sp. FL0255]
MPFSTKNLVRFTGMLALAAGANAQPYTIQDTFDTTNFFDGFEFFTGADPTAGFVNYVDATTANATSLAGYTEGGIYLGVDYTTTNPASPGRDSVRVNSINSYTHGLFIVDLAHMPSSACGSWPAWWTVGPNWPNDGEIDIIEGVNSNNYDTITLHTAEGCSFSSSSWSSADCGANSGSTGCGNPTSNTQTYGDGFNAIGGGVYAMQWSSSAINIFFFPRSSIPSDITAGTPDPSGWGSPLAGYSGGSCNIDSYFQQHQIVFDTTFCGQWAGQSSVWSADATCSALADSCQDYVAANPSAFQDSYWLINSVKVYSEAGNSTSTRRALAFNA